MRSRLVSPPSWRPTTSSGPLPSASAIAPIRRFLQQECGVLASRMVTDEHRSRQPLRPLDAPQAGDAEERSEEHPSELQSLLRLSYAVFCLNKKQYRTNSSSSDIKL